MISARRRSIQAAIVGLVMSALCFTAAPALAAAPTSTSDTSSTFPVVPNAPAWYSTSQPAPYSASGYGQVSGQGRDDSVWFEQVAYYAPSGAAPKSVDGSRPADIEVTNFGVVTLFSPLIMDPEVAILNVSDPFPQMITDLGTSMTTGIVLPVDPNSPRANDAFPTVRFLGRGLVEVRRPAFPSSCNAVDPETFTVETAMLGENGYKYGVELNVTFGDRGALRKQVCAGMGKTISIGIGGATSISSKVAGAKKSVTTKATDAKKSVKTKVADVKTGVKKDLSKAANKLKLKAYSGALAVVLVSLLVLAALLLGLHLFRKLRRPNDHNNDGTSIRPERDSTGGASRTKSASKSGYGR